MAAVVVGVAAVVVARGDAKKNQSCNLFGVNDMDLPVSSPQTLPISSACL